MTASPVITWVGGICWVPSAERTMESTTEIFTKLVTIISAKGTRPMAASARMRMSGRDVKVSAFTASLATESGMLPGRFFCARAMKGCSDTAAAKSQGVTRGSRERAGVWTFTGQVPSSAGGLGRRAPGAAGKELLKERAQGNHVRLRALRGADALHRLQIQLRQQLQARLAAAQEQVLVRGLHHEEHALGVQRQPLHHGDDGLLARHGPL